MQGTDDLNGTTICTVEIVRSITASNNFVKNFSKLVLILVCRLVSQSKICCSGTHSTYRKLPSLRLGNFATLLSLSMDLSFFAIPELKATDFSVYACRLSQVFYMVRVFYNIYIASLCFLNISKLRNSENYFSGSKSRTIV